MYSHILVPLDGSDLAEQILSHVKQIAAINPQTTITLLRSVPPIFPVSAEYSGVFISPDEQISALQQEARSYLDRIADGLRAEGYTVQIEVSDLPAAEAIVDYAEHHGVKLIAIATHGRSGLSRWVFGSVTQKVLHVTTLPVLVVRPKDE
jgi:nucleotide-binding universal stress UspA family protein